MGEIPNVSVSFDGDLDGNVLITVWDDETADPHPMFKGRIRAHQVPDFVIAATSHGVHALETSISAIATGDCKRCGNVRMVKDEKGSSIHCPSCGGSKDPRQVLRDRPSWRT